MIQIILDLFDLIRCCKKELYKLNTDEKISWFYEIFLNIIITMSSRV